MAATSKIVKLVSTAGTGYYYTIRKTRNVVEKLVFRKFDPRALRPDGKRGMHVEFKEAKVK